MCIISLPNDVSYYKTIPSIPSMYHMYLKIQYLGSKIIITLYIKRLFIFYQMSFEDICTLESYRM